MCLLLPTLGPSEGRVRQAGVVLDTLQWEAWKRVLGEQLWDFRAQIYLGYTAAVFRDKS